MGYTKRLAVIVQLSDDNSLPSGFALVFFFDFAKCSMDLNEMRSFHKQFTDMHLIDLESDIFEKMQSDVRCNDTPLLREKSEGMHDCKKKCQRDPGCKFFAYWTKSKWCETYESCESQSADGKKSIYLYKRIDPCATVFDSYLKNIPRIFLKMQFVRIVCPVCRRRFKGRDDNQSSIGPIGFRPSLPFHGGGFFDHRDWSAHKTNRLRRASRRCIPKSHDRNGSYEPRPMFTYKHLLERDTK